MERFNIPRVLIAAPGSGSGKTTIVCGILQALLKRKLNICSFKCGPDYIDPMFHKEALGIESRNLDLFFNKPDMVNYLLYKNSCGRDLAVIEGVMGYYDGLGGKSYEASSYHLSKATRTPTILIVDAKGKSLSILAEISGFLNLEPDSNIRGVILNRISPMIYEEIKYLIEEKLQIKVVGYVPEMKECSLESRHLGLVTAQEVGNLPAILERLSNQISESVNLDLLLELAAEAPQIRYRKPEVKKGSKVRLAVARDKAFCFYYEDNLDLLKEMGAEICFFSPMHHRKLPENIDGIYIGGGYPELYLRELCENSSMLQDIKEAVTLRKIPCMAECGGFMYLHDIVKDKTGQGYPMVGLVPGESFYAGKLVRFGYIDMEALKDNMLLKAGERIRGHEFHYWDSTNPGELFLARKPLRKKNWNCIYGDENLYAGYPHVHFYSNISAAERFMDRCREKR